jgi:hypothetical protein
VPVVLSGIGLSVDSFDEPLSESLDFASDFSSSPLGAKVDFGALSAGAAAPLDCIEPVAGDCRLCSVEPGAPMTTGVCETAGADPTGPEITGAPLYGELLYVVVVEIGEVDTPVPHVEQPGAVTGAPYVVAGIIVVTGAPTPQVLHAGATGHVLQAGA